LKDVTGFVVDIHICDALSRNQSLVAVYERPYFSF